MPKDELRKDLIALIALMRNAQSKRMPRSRGQERRVKIAGRLSVPLRPPEVNDWLFSGHWIQVDQGRRQRQRQRNGLAGRARIALVSPGAFARPHAGQCGQGATGVY